MIKIIPGLTGAQYAAGKHALAIVVDALRASATLCAFFSRGVSSVSVCSDVESARNLAQMLGEAILAGEKNSIKPEDFDLGNSPLEALNADIVGKDVVFTSSNGARMLVAAHGSYKVLVGTVCNASALINETRAAMSRGKEVVLIPAGDDDHDCLEDMVSCAAIAQALGLDIDPGQAELLSRLHAKIALSGLTELFLESKHGKELVNSGFRDDVVFASRPDILPVVPEVFKHYTLGNSPVALLSAALKNTGT